MIYFKKQFAEELHNEDLDKLSHEEKIESLGRLYSLAKSKNLERDFMYKILFEILSLGPRVGKYDKQLFMEFIKVSDRTKEFYADNKQQNKRIDKMSKKKSYNRFA